MPKPSLCFIARGDVLSLPQEGTHYRYRKRGRIIGSDIRQKRPTLRCKKSLTTSLEKLERYAMYERPQGNRVYVGAFDEPDHITSIDVPIVPQQTGAIHSRSRPLRKRQVLQKRLLDLALAVVLIVVTLPCQLLIALSIRLDSRG